MTTTKSKPKNAPKLRSRNTKSSEHRPQKSTKPVGALRCAFIWLGYGGLGDARAYGCVKNAEEAQCKHFGALDGWLVEWMVVRTCRKCAFRAQSKQWGKLTQARQTQQE